MVVGARTLTHQVFKYMLTVSCASVNSRHQDPCCPGVQLHIARSLVWQKPVVAIDVAHVSLIPHIPHTQIGVVAWGRRNLQVRLVDTDNLIANANDGIDRNQGLRRPEAKEASRGDIQETRLRLTQSRIRSITPPRSWPSVSTT
jgi:hypothetical protein